MNSHVVASTRLVELTRYDFHPEAACSRCDVRSCDGRVKTRMGKICGESLAIWPIWVWLRRWKRVVIRSASDRAYPSRSSAFSTRGREARASVCEQGDEPTFGSRRHG